MSSFPGAGGGSAAPVGPGFTESISPLQIVAMSVYCLVLVTYAAWFISGLKTERKGFTTARMINTAPSFVGKMVRMPGTEMASVQTLRNVILSLSFIATLAFTTATEVANAIIPQQDVALGLEEIRKLVLSCLLYLAFLNFAISLRSACHVSVLMASATGQLDPGTIVQSKHEEQALGVGTVGQGDDSQAQGQTRLMRAISAGSLSAAVGADGADATAPVPDAAPARPGMPPATAHDEACAAEKSVASPTNAREAAHLARRSTIMISLMYIHFSLGFRCFYLAIPIALWRAGPLPLLLSSLFMGLFLFIVDSEVTLMP